jgi:uncharacterized protein (DUF1499 family)
MFYRQTFLCHSGRPVFRHSHSRSGAIRLWLLVPAIVLVALLLTGVVILALTVEDWNRDLSTNQAATSQEHSDPSLRCVVLPLDIEAATELVQNRATKLAGWRMATASANPAHVIRFERTTRWLRFVDEVTVELNPVDGGTRVSVSSRSRVGKGDLGQNPRNIRELLKAIQGS